MEIITHNGNVVTSDGSALRVTEMEGLRDVTLNGTSIVAGDTAVLTLTQAINGTSGVNDIPSARAVYNVLGNIEAALAEL